MSKNNNFFSIKTAVVVILACLATVPVYADVSGTVYRELPVNGSSPNSYGIREANEPGVAGIAVTVTGDNGITETVQTDDNGSWTTTKGVGAFGGQVRVTFSNIPGYLYPGVVNTNSKTTVQFVAEGSTDVDLGLHNPADYSSVPNPMMGAPRYLSGDPLLGGASGARTGFVGFRHSFSGDGRIGQSGDDFIPFATTAQIGSAWGVAYQRSSETIFVAASYRRHVGLGPLNTGGIYSIDFSSQTPGTVTSWLDVNTLGGVNTGNDPRAAGTDLDAEGNSRTYDWRAYPAVGKIAMGDMDISEDDKTLYVVNLNDKTVIPVDIATKSLAGAVISIPDPGCSNGDYRPWGLDVHQGELYLGVVCSAETSKLRSDLKAHVMKLENGTFSSIFNFNLGYERGYSFDVLGEMGKDAKWEPWTDDYYGKIVPDGWLAEPWNNGTQFFSATPQPILADIEFDIDGSMILSFMDRHAYQSGYNTWIPDPGESQTDMEEWTISAGDVLRACPDNSGGWSLESNATCGGVGPTSGKNTQQGPGGGEFYHGDEFFEDDTNVHQELFLGGIAMLPGSGTVATTSFDPIYEWTNAGGIRWLDNTTGESVQAYQIYMENYPPEQGKSIGLGDIEIFADPAPLQIGNRVWDDENSNGIQDAGEAGIDGVEVTLNCGGEDFTQTTANGGQYLFTDANVTGGIPRNTSCTISVPTTVNGDMLTLQNNALNEPLGSNPDRATGSFTFTTGAHGQNNHTYDIGYAEPKVDLELTKTVLPSSAERGDTVTYTIVIYNKESNDATGVQVTDKLPDTLEYVSHTTVDGSYDEDTGIWTVGGVAGNTNAVLNIKAKVK